MNLVVHVQPALRGVMQTAEFVFDRFVRRPLRGLAVACEGLALLLPDLAEATVTAVVQAVTAQLSHGGRVRMAQGLRQLVWGLKQMAWPLALTSVLVIWQLPAVFWLMTALVVLLLLSCERSAPTLRVVPAP